MADPPPAQPPSRERHAVLLRLDPQVYDALARWAGDDLRSVNAQIEMLLRRALADAGRAPTGAAPIPDAADHDNNPTHHPQARPPRHDPAPPAEPRKEQTPHPTTRAPATDSANPTAPGGG